MCRIDDCSGSPPISIRPASSERPLVLAANPGAVLCETCRPRPLSAPCSKMGVGVERVELDWDGGFYELSTCGAGVPCAARREAAPGRYVAELCAIRSSRTIDSIGAPVCTDTGQRVCSRIELSYPGPDVSAEL